MTTSGLVQNALISSAELPIRLPARPLIGYDCAVAPRAVRRHGKDFPNFVPPAGYRTTVMVRDSRTLPAVRRAT